MSEANSSGNAANTNANGDGGNNSPNNQNANAGGNAPAGAEDAVKNAQAVLAKNKELLAEINRLKGENKAFLDKASGDEQEKLIAAGKKDEAIASLQKQIADLKTQRESERSAYGKATVKDQILAAAKSMGADKPEYVLSLIDQGGISVDDGFQVNKEQLDSALAKVKEDIPALFRKGTAQMDDLNPTSGKDLKNQRADLKQKSRSELRDLYMKTAQKK